MKKWANQLLLIIFLVIILTLSAMFKSSGYEGERVYLPYVTWVYRPTPTLAPTPNLGR